MNITNQSKKITIRNLTIFTVVVLTVGWIGRELDVLLGNPPSESLGMLLWIITPLATCILLRSFAGDGWKDFGFKPNFKGNSSGYIISILVFPVVILFILIIGRVSNAVSLSGSALNTLVRFLPVFALALLPGFFKNIFEESAWRGYLTPKVYSLNLNDYVGHLIVGLIWALWHIPYYLFFLDRVVLGGYTTLSLSMFIPLALASIISYSFVFGEIRLLTNSIWPVVLMHMVEDALINPLLVKGFIEVNPGMDFLFSPGVGILAIISFTATGVGFRRLRKRVTSPQSLSQGNT
jgi:membrane protease YdiL (CAAX protease family)